MEKKSNFKIGESVVINKGLVDPLSGCDIKGWQGRIFNIGENDKGEIMLEIVWDSVTLKNMPFSFIEEYDARDWDWGRMNMQEMNVEPAKSRDTEDDVWDMREKAIFPDISEEFGEEVKGLRDALAPLGIDDDRKALRAWWNKCRKEMLFPFEARIIFSPDEEDDEEEGGEEIVKIGEQMDFKEGDIVEVTHLSDLDDLMGIIIGLKSQGERYAYALSDLEPTDPDSPNYQIIREYGEWFNKREI
ncbi:hypothetical protein JW926_06000 [Candidatus Sumerlaeota bacterium]|nr:hypothetical protein [Candidatus Sumerlaeota bacterium]